MEYNKEVSLMNELCDKYNTDKGTNSIDANSNFLSHNYTIVYAKMFKNIKDQDLIIFECGIGTNNVKIPSNMGENGSPGASLRLWKDYFSKAHIYGADIDKDIIFQEPRISTGYMDQTDQVSINNFFEGFNNFCPNIVIDDALHTYEAAISLYENVYPRLKSGGVYVIEDVKPDTLNRLCRYFSRLDSPKIQIREHINGNTRIDNTLFIIYK